MPNFKDNFKASKQYTLDEMAKVVRGGFITCAQNIILGSPVDTGRFRANWQVSINEPKLDTKYNTGADADPDNYWTDTDDVVGKTVGYTINDVLYLTNNLPYARDLADGRSDQASDGWIDVEVINAKQAIKNNLTKLAGDD